MITILSIIYTDIEQRCYSSDGKTLTKVDDTSKYLRISAKCELIQDKCFYQLNSLISFSFQDNPNLTTIGKESFRECIKLSIIDLSSCNKLKIISEEAFYHCEKVTEILLPKGLLEIQFHAFANNILVTSVTIPASVEIIESLGFQACSKLENVTFEEGSKLTSLEYCVFSFTSITSFQIPENVANVNGAAFGDAKLTNLTIHPKNKFFVIENNNFVLSPNKSILFFICNKSSEIPDSVTTLGKFLFYRSKLKSITFSSSLTTIENDCFEFSKLVSVTIPKSVNRIESYAFGYCDDLMNVTFLGLIDYIDEKIFIYCDNLELIVFPNSSMIVNSYQFSSSNSPKIKMSYTHKSFFSSRSILRNTIVSISYINESDLIITPKLFIMNSNPTIIYEYWEYINSDSHSITIPKNVTTIKKGAFENSIVSIIKFESDSQLLEIEKDAFRNCSNLNSFSFSSSVLFTIGISAFKGCSKLASVSFASTNLNLMGNTFENCSNLVSVNNIKDIPNSCFSGCSKLKTVNIIENSKVIGYKSFENCYSLENINIPSTVETISENAFLNCIKLKSITFPQQNSLEKISNNSFSGCNSLQSISNFESDKYKCIDNTLYYKNETGKYLIYHAINSPDKVLSLECNVICSYSFNECNNIIDIKIVSDSVSLIEQFSFNNCKNLQHINFPFSVKTVESNSFFECNSIRCPLIIENTTFDYLKMIIDSGIPQRLLFSCGVVQGSYNIHAIKRMFSNSPSLFWRHLSK